MLNNTFQRTIDKAKKSPELWSNRFTILISISIGIATLFIGQSDDLVKQTIIIGGLIGIVAIILSRNISSSNKINAELLQKFSRGFIAIPENQIYGLLRSEVMKAENSIMVIGNGYITQQSKKYNKQIKGYFDAIEKKCEITKGFQYKRITSLNINHKSLIHKHIRNIILKQNDSFQIRQIPYFDSVYTYVIIDEEFLIVHMVKDGNSEEYESNHLCKDTEQVKDYIAHFKKVYEDTSPVKTIAQYDLNRTFGLKYWNQVNSLYSKLPKLYSNSFHPTILQTLINMEEVSISPAKQIKKHKRLNEFTELLINLFNSMKDLPDNSAIRSYIEYEIELLRFKTEHLFKGQLTIPHDLENYGKFEILNTFFKILKANNTYKAISVDKFWMDMSKKQRDNFNSLNEEKLMIGSNIHRHLIVSKNQIEEELSLGLGIMIDQLRIHWQLAKKHKSYKFNFSILGETQYKGTQWNKFYMQNGLEETIIKFWHNKNDPNSNRDIYSEIWSNLSQPDNSVLFRNIKKEFESEFQSLESQARNKSRIKDSTYSKVIQLLD